MATAPRFEGSDAEWDEGMKIQEKALSDRDDLIREIRNRNELDLAKRHRKFLGLGGRKSRRYSKKSGRKSRKSRRHSKKSSKRSCRR